MESQPSLRAEVGAIPSDSEELSYYFTCACPFEAEPWNMQAGNVVDRPGSQSRLRARPCSLYFCFLFGTPDDLFRIFAAGKMAPKDFLWFVQCWVGVVGALKKQMRMQREEAPDPWLMHEEQDGGRSMVQVLGLQTRTGLAFRGTRVAYTQSDAEWHKLDLSLGLSQHLMEVAS